MSTDDSSTSTGAHVINAAASQNKIIRVPCTTIDRILAEAADGESGHLLKLDLQGYELNALRGAQVSMRQIDVILTEVSFYAQAYEPPIATLVAFLADNGFELYDIAALSSRRRDDRPHQADFVFVRSDSPLAADRAWG
jgi:hypothetical protein